MLQQQPARVPGPAHLGEPTAPGGRFGSRGRGQLSAGQAAVVRTQIRSPHATVCTGNTLRSRLRMFPRHLEPALGPACRPCHNLRLGPRESALQCGTGAGMEQTSPWASLHPGCPRALARPLLWGNEHGMREAFEALGRHRGGCPSAPATLSP